METIKEIIAEMRKDIPRVVDAKVILRNYADRIEQAVTDCNQLKMREALLIVKKLFDGQIMFQNAIREAHKAVNDALSTLPLYETEDEAYQAYLKETRKQRARELTKARELEIKKVKGEETK